MESGKDFERPITVSVIVPVYNGERFLQECIESVLVQSMPDWELILVDDGSTDDSNRICREYAAKDRRIRLLEQQNKGVSAARNAGLDAMRGRFVTFLDADDELYPEALRLLYDNAEKAGLGMVIGRSLHSVARPAIKHSSVRRDKANSSPREEEEKGRGGIMVIDAVSLCHAILYRIPFPDASVCGRLYGRELFDGLRFYDGRYEDLEISPKLILRAGRAGVLDKPVYFYRNNPESFINTWSESRRDAVKVTCKIMESFAKRSDIDTVSATAKNTAIDATSDIDENRDIDTVSATVKNPAIYSRHQKGLYRAAQNRHFRANFNLLLELLRHRPDDKDGINECFGEIKRFRGSVITDSCSLLSTTVGALLSYAGMAFLRLLAFMKRK